MRRSLVIGIVVALLALGLAFRFSVMVFSLYAMTLVYLAATALARSALDGVSITRSIARDRADVDETMTIRALLRNEKPWPVFWLLVEEVLPRRLLPRGDFLRLLVLGPRSSRTLEYHLTFTVRGYHQIGPVILESGDLFGFVRHIRTARTAHYITVRPVPQPILRYDIATHRPIGEIRSRRQIYEDPTRLAGVREYRVGDPLNRIEWRATARTGELHSRIYEATVLAGAYVLLDFHRPAWESPAGEPAGRSGEYTAPSSGPMPSHAASFVPPRQAGEAEALFGESEAEPDGVPPESDAAELIDEAPLPSASARPPRSAEARMELGVTVAASLASYVLDLGESAGLLSNGLDAAERVKRETGLAHAGNRREARAMAERREGDDRLRPVTVRPGRGVEKTGEVLDALARLEPSEGLTLRKLVFEELQRLPRDLTLLVVTPQLDRELAQAVAALKFSGVSVSVFLVDNPASWQSGRGLLSAQRVPAMHIREPEDLHEIAMRGL